MNDKIAIIGLGYVGLPLAHAFAEKYEVVGFDINQSRIDELNDGHDRTLELSNIQLAEVKDKMIYDKLYKGQPLIEVDEYNKKTRAITLVNSEKDRKLDKKRTELYLKSLSKIWPFEINIDDGETIFSHTINGFTNKRKPKK